MPAGGVGAGVAWPSAGLPGWQLSAPVHPDAPALICGAQRSSHGQLWQAVLAVAAALDAQGIRPGDRVVLLLDNGIACAAAIQACLLRGAVFVPLNPRTRADKLVFLLRDCEAALLLTQAGSSESWRPAVSSCRQLRAIWVVGLDTLEPAQREGLLPWPLAPQAPSAVGPDHPAPGDDDLAALLYTSGTTGFPKGVMLSRRNIGHAARSIQSYLGLRADDVIACPLPLSHTYGLYQVLIGLAVGAAVVLDRHARLPLPLLAHWASEGVSVLPATPMLLGMLLPHAGSADCALPRLRLITSAAEALSPAREQAVRQAWPRAAVLAMYGLTECARASYRPDDAAQSHPGSVGRGMPGAEHWLADDQGRRLPPGSTGELVIRGPHVMLGYWRRPDETAERLRPVAPGSPERVLFTGDLFRSDPEGWLYFVARRDEMIKTRGEKVSPREIENAIHGLPGVLEVAVAGESDALLGQAIVAHVVRCAGSALTEREVQRHCRALLEPHLVPQAVKFVAELPKTDSGKLRRASLPKVLSPASARGNPHEP